MLQEQALEGPDLAPEVVVLGGRLRRGGGTLDRRRDRGRGVGPCPLGPFALLGEQRGRHDDRLADARARRAPERRYHRLGGRRRLHQRSRRRLLHLRLLHRRLFDRCPRLLYRFRLRRGLNRRLWRLVRDPRNLLSRTSPTQPLLGLHLLQLLLVADAGRHPRRACLRTRVAPCLHALVLLDPRPRLGYVLLLGVRVVPPAVLDLTHGVVGEDRVRRVDVPRQPGDLPDLRVLLELGEVDVGRVRHGVRVGVEPGGTGHGVGLLRLGREGRLDDHRCLHLGRRRLHLHLGRLPGDKVAVGVAYHRHRDLVAVGVEELLLRRRRRSLHLLLLRDLLRGHLLLRRCLLCFSSSNSFNCVVLCNQSG